ncbi:MAG: hypothetical protein HZC01_01995 [Candidatus Kerfeldbacteria bacterium]|nr:hypothetical protein [Candidatus Kerfeldbacteria bacterium]
MFAVLPKQHRLPILLTVVLASAVGAVVLIFVISTRYYDTEGNPVFTYAHAQSITFDPGVPAVLEQAFIASQPDLARIQFTVINERLSHDIRASVRSYGERERLLEQVVTISPEPGPQTITLTLPPVAHSKDAQFILSIDQANADGLTWLALPHDWYPDGRLLINGEAYASNLVFSFDYYEPNPLVLLMKRLPIYKPGIWHHTASFVLAYGVFISIVLWFSFQFARKSSDR